MPLFSWKNVYLYHFAALKKSARAREYENALQWLHDAGLIYKVNLVNTIKIPLKGFEDNQNFKVYALDTGLLTAMAKIPPAIILLIIITEDLLLLHYQIIT